MFWLEWVTAVAAIFVSILGVFVAVGQLTSATRARRLVTFWGEQLESTELGRDKEVAQSLHREATARVIALQAYPGVKVFVLLLVALLAVLSLGAAAYIAGASGPGSTSYGHWLVQPYNSVTVLLATSELIRMTLVSGPRSAFDVDIWSAGILMVLI